MMVIVGIHILLSVLVGFCTYLVGRRGDFLMFFALSLVITPLFALFILMIGTPRTVEVGANAVSTRKDI